MSSECLKFNAIPANDSNLSEEASLSGFEIYDSLKENLIPTINSISMITQMIEQQALGPLDLGPYKDYLEALKACVDIQEKFSQDLAVYLRQTN